MIEPEAVEKVLAPLAVEKIWGVGKVTAQELHKLSIRTIDDLRHFPLDVLAERLGSFAPALADLAWGIDDRPVVTSEQAKSIGAERTFSRDLSGADELRARLDEMVDEVARRLRAHGLKARTIHLKARYPDFTTHTRAVTLARPTSLTRQIRDAARDLLEKRLERRRRPLRLLGVSLSNFEADDEGQIELFTDERFGKTTIRRGNS